MYRFTVKIFWSICATGKLEQSLYFHKLIRNIGSEPETDKSQHNQCAYVQLHRSIKFRKISVNPI